MAPTASVKFIDVYVHWCRGFVIAKTGVLDVECDAEVGIKNTARGRSGKCRERV